MFGVSLKQGAGALHSDKQIKFQHLKWYIIDISKVEEALLQKENKLAEKVDGNSKIFDVFEVSKQQYKERILLDSSKSYLL